MEFKKKYNGTEAEQIFERFKYYCDKNNNIPMSDMIEVLNRCTSLRMINKINELLLRTYATWFTAEHEEYVKTLINKEYISLPIIEQIYTHKVFSQDTKNLFVYEYFKNNSITFNLDYIKRIVGNGFDDVLCERLISPEKVEIAVEEESIYKCVKYFGMERTVDFLIKKVDNTINSCENSNESIYSKLCVIEKTLKALCVEFKGNKYERNKPVSVKLEVSNEVLQDFYKRIKPFIKLLQSDMEKRMYYEVMNIFKKVIEIDDDSKARVNRQVVLRHMSDTFHSNSFTKDLQHNNISIADAVKYVVEILTQGKVELGKETYDSLNAFEVMKNIMGQR